MTYTASAERSEPEGHNVLVPTEYQGTQVSLTHPMIHLTCYFSAK